MIRKLVAAVAAAALAVLALPAPAQAGPQKLDHYVLASGYPEVLQQTFPVDEELHIIGCVKCWGLLVLHYGDNDPNPIEVDIFAGLSLLGQARYTTDARIRDQLRTQALARFEAAARGLRGQALRVTGVGYYDPESGRRTLTASLPWLTAAADDIADGINTLQRVAGEPFPDPWRQAGLATLERAYAEIAGKVAGGPSPDPW
ncbi:hypothetical protein [Dactylosporangium sp. NPDC051541]|uniref:hypothetical protein n=1 Tax=Dactylosporangium sp. NPDC051541 TaxID=3363977 RepID=UPI0037A13E5A